MLICPVGNINEVLVIGAHEFLDEVEDEDMVVLEVHCCAWVTSDNATVYDVSYQTKGTPHDFL